MIARVALEEALQPMIAGVGLLGNLVTIIVLSKPEMKTTFNHSLIALAALEIFFLLNGKLNLFNQKSMKCELFSAAKAAQERQMSVSLSVSHSVSLSVRCHFF